MQGLRTNEGPELGTPPRSPLVDSMGIFVSWNPYMPGFRPDRNSAGTESLESEVTQFHEEI